MNRHVSLASMLRSVWLREWAIAGVLVFAWMVVLALVAWRLAGAWAAAGVVLLSACALSIYAKWRTRSLDKAWLTRSLDAASPQLQDSSALLDADTQPHEGLQRLQAHRVQAAFARVDPPDLRRAWPARALALSYALAAVSLLVPFIREVPARETTVATPAAGRKTVRRDTAPHLTSVRLTIRPPAYTGMPVREEDTVGARVPVGSALRWSVRVAPAVNALALATHDGKLLPFTFADGEWHGGTTLTRSMLVRAEAGGTRLDPRLHRVVAVPDKAPRIRMLQPLQTLGFAKPGQRRFELVFLASDDYGIATAKLDVTLAQGSGENIGVRTQTILIGGSGLPRSRRLVASLDLTGLGMQPGDDLIAQLRVEDNRKPRAQTTRSASAILRWPLPPGKDQSSLDGLVQRVLPAYFRSQRQIIIDSEALIVQRVGLAPDDFVARSNAIGVDQRVLRLRYGQFLGEEDSGGKHSPAGELADIAPDVASDAAKHAPDSLFADSHAHVETSASETFAGAKSVPVPSEVAPGNDALHDDASHEDGPQSGAMAFGESASMTEAFGHAHDIPEAATLLDPATQKLLRAALGEMWQAELHLRQGFPQRALPFENRALELIKKLQQADRIYLAKTGSQIPPVEEARRLTGKREGLRDRKDTLGPVPARAVALTALWSALGRVPLETSNAVLAPLQADAETWLMSRQDPSAHVLDAIAAMDAVRMEPDCEACLQSLRKRLWVLLPQPAAGVGRRDAADAQQRAYLDALARERQR